MTAELSPRTYADPVTALLSAQDGVVSRAQLVDAGCDPHDLERMLRRKELFVALPGVYVNHNGPRSWNQRAWVAVLACWPAALAGASALRAESGPGLRGFDDSAAIEVAVDVSRTVRDKPDVRVRRMAGLQPRSRWNASPPRVRYEEAVLDVVAGLPREWDVIEACAAAVRGRCTTAPRLAKALAARHRFPRRTWLARVLADVAAGTASVLEHGYLDKVERAHGLPAADRQQPDRIAGGRVYRDARYPAYDLDVELDGRLDHSALADRDSDLERDLDTATRRRRSVRLGWGQVYDRPCRTAAQVARLLAIGGWEGTPTPCSPTCSVGGV
ncbi:type IV toxin-antitoxin system AbiEi family antitoxin domain-containing protein [Nocardioides zhouii]|uniref:type IV toxin-antitoxin system AbiEi family antitoxin domain-containing protein n=1 Tax=Nocardioides zhouii TaxID=1168729 RepID=UPI001A93291D|nr:type IV toxin-antitoxin system AbiEi family antitoxin domain-containing protein [Nocardioides zhouii]